MKLALFAERDGRAQAGLLTEAGVIPFGDLQPAGASDQAIMTAVIDGFDDLRPALEALAQTGKALPLDKVRLLPPLPRPGKILNCIANYWEHAQREARPLNMFMKNPDAVVGPGDTIELPDFDEPWAFMHEAELVVVIKGPAKKVSQENWRDAVFGYTCGIDVTARGEGRITWKKGSWLGKSFDTFAPLGPCIVTVDEIPEPNDLHVQFWNNGELRHNFNTDDMEHRVPEIVEFASRIMTLNSGDVLFTGTNHEGLGFLQDGETVRIKIHGIGEMELTVADPLKRSWDRGVYMGHDSTNHEAVKRHRPKDDAVAALR
ncbi:fumarylacetoacetate hydrolase family protein [Novosphingobium sp. BL-52-GroH]|uniref:fumarylacetoacetate hydrolase family protein n=1 Tax=Novosphingobium sp. BL-52-GroH TaxID=3349877 RepID=UPI0038508996